MTFKLENTKVPVEVLKTLLAAKKLHLCGSYLVLTRHPSFSGHLSKHKLGEFAEAIGKSQITAYRHLRELWKLGLVMEHNTVWMACGADYYTATCARTRCKRVKYHKDIKSLAIATIISEQIEHQWGEHLKRLREAPTKGPNDSFKATISASYTQMYLYTQMFVSYSTQYISRMRKRAKNQGLLRYDRRREFVTKFDAQCLEFYLDDNKRRFDAPKMFQKRSGDVVFELPAQFSRGLHLYSRGISNSLKVMARAKYKLLAMA